jgi:hypothetical protein
LEQALKISAAQAKPTQTRPAFCNRMIESPAALSGKHDSFLRAVACPKIRRKLRKHANSGRHRASLDKPQTPS